ncbi:hypothetical protein DRO58_03015 [Candidatus Bathyarchaeota archaeon]|nr:MAG: hypothetical protein DRO58_03015 [Candidatus Bathyarchaeota archaeon]
MSVSAFEKVFLNALRRTLRELMEYEEGFKNVRDELRSLLRRRGIGEEVRRLMDQIPPYVFGSLVADIAIGAILEGSSRELRIQKMVADVVVRAFGEKGIQTLLERCNIEAAKNMLGEEKVEEVAERITTEDIFQTDEYEEFCKAIAKLLEETLK